MNGITADQLAVFAAVCVVLVGIYNSVMAARSNHRAEQERRTRPLAELQADVDQLRRRVETLQQKNHEHADEMKLVLRSQLALLRHGIDGNNIQGLRDSQADIQKYLVNK